MKDEYEIIHVVGEGRAVKDNKTGKIYYSEFQIIEELKEELKEIKKEHSIMKQFIYENGLWEKFLNDDRFIEHLRSE